MPIFQNLLQSYSSDTGRRIDLSVSGVELKVQKWESEIAPNLAKLIN